MYKEELKNAVIKYTSGDAEAFSDIYNLTKDGFYHLVYSITENAELAEDILQDAYVKISTSVFQLEAPEAFLNWSRTLIRRMAWDKCNRQAKREILLDEDNEFIFEEIEEEQRDCIPEADFDRKEVSAIVREIMEELPLEQRLALLYFYREEDKLQEIAESMNCPVGTVKSRLNKGRITLLEKVKAYEEQHDIRLHAMLPLPFILTVLKDMEMPYPKVPETLNVISNTIVQSAKSATESAAVGSVDNVSQINKITTKSKISVDKQSTSVSLTKPSATVVSKGIASAGTMKIVSIIVAIAVVIGSGGYGIHRIIGKPSITEEERILDAYSEYFADYEGLREFTHSAEQDDEWYNCALVKQNGVPN